MEQDLEIRVHSNETRDRRLTLFGALHPIKDRSRCSVRFSGPTDCRIFPNSRTINPLDNNRDNNYISPIGRWIVPSPHGYFLSEVFL